ncbi:MAG: 16S rRNA (adenine(1518)-N(6)/adenine(1519)-N(6))-dimethyltransferase RsmA [Deltaproteobacteria bacterium]|nr:16S rRNA (adenine(1518)-N(6)/adenine(1519)-N(6))-dimethyltransferase RsmA [Deltaproteobacteria bacterium]
MTTPRTLLKAWALHPKKRLGQNFLSEPATSRMIVTRADVTKNDVVLEIGAGLGSLTIPLAKQVKKVVAVEKDRRLLGLLTAELVAAQVDNVTVIDEDILKLDIQSVSEREQSPLVVFGNLPYNISSQIVLKLIADRKYLNRAVVMFQKELAQRLIAPPGSKTYGRISVMVQYCASVRPIATIPSTVFFPKPQVDSEVIEINFKDDDRQQGDDAYLFAVIKAAFSKRRKTLKNALAASELKLDPAVIQHALDAAGIDGQRRAETLSVSEFVDLSRRL